MKVRLKQSDSDAVQFFAPGNPQHDPTATPVRPIADFDGAGIYATPNVAGNIVYGLTNQTAVEFRIAFLYLDDGD